MFPYEKKSTLFTKHVNFYACKNQIKPQMFLFYATEILHITIIAQQIQPQLMASVRAKLNLFVRQLQTKLVNFQLEGLENCFAIKYPKFDRRMYFQPLNSDYRTR